MTKSLKNLFANYSNVWGSLLLIAAALGYEANIDNNTFLKVLLIVSFGTPLLIMLIRARGELASYRSKRIIENEINKKDPKNVPKQNVSQHVIPNTKAFQAAFSLLKEKANKWAKDAVITNFEFRIQVNSNNKIWWYELRFHSNWKKTQGIEHISNLKQLKYRSAYFPDSGIPKQLAQPFFARYANWRKAVELAFEKIGDSIQDEYVIELSSRDILDNDIMKIEIRYKRGQLSVSDEFAFNGRTLTCLTDGTAQQVH